MRVKLILIWGCILVIWPAPFLNALQADRLPTQYRLTIWDEEKGPHVYDCNQEITHDVNTISIQCFMSCFHLFSTFYTIEITSVLKITQSSNNKSVIQISNPTKIFTLGNEEVLIL